MKEIYLDNAATTPVRTEVADHLYKLVKENYGNPSSLHLRGLDAERAVETARGQVAAALGCDKSCLLFTSGGTEANNTAVFGAADAYRRNGTVIATTLFEHASVLEPFKRLEQQGMRVLYLNPTLPAEELAGQIPEECYFVSMMLVNNELGTILDIARISKLLRQRNPRVILHCDAVQAFGKLPCRPESLGVDLMSISAHKIYAPKGAGALYVKKGVRFTPLLYGGHQQKSLRPGTESVPLIGAFGLASQLSQQELRDGMRHMKGLHDLLLQELSGIDGIHTNSPADGIPNIVNLSVPGIRSEIMLHFLESRGIYVSSGSACAKGEASHVLRALGLTPQLADSALRVSFGRQNTRQDVLDFAAALQAGIRTIRR
ncbi:cysteine desulfurase family protein [Candidatus Soleaferrea massiliensis]|uniref:cysteine desulfurase family protein n=1 Tax=Candidatus Soleaferrea massiliensis TaxID=1470354 RepID=UPI000590117A|nr:cysteine desulfurase family protein [Candidatus Soleaferrea massiliensis]